MKKLVKNINQITQIINQAKLLKRLQQRGNAQTSLGYERFTIQGLGYNDSMMSTCYAIPKGKDITNETKKEEQLIVDLYEVLIEFEEDSKATINEL